MSPRNTGRGSRRQRHGPSVGVFSAIRQYGGDFGRKFRRRMFTVGKKS